MVDNLRVRLHLEFSRLRNVHEAGKKLLPGNGVVVEAQVSVVYVVVANLLTNVSDRDSRQRSMCLHVSDLDKVRLNAVITFSDYAPREYDCVVRKYSQRTWPELGCFHCGCVYDEFVLLHVKRRCRLQALHV